jgi:hypothetical protein
VVAAVCVTLGLIELRIGLTRPVDAARLLFSVSAFAAAVVCGLEMWEVEGVVGTNLTHCIFTEIGYRALSVDYNNDGLLFDTITHGPQITTGITF